MLTNQNDRRRIKTLFLANIDTYRLGARAVGGGAWKNASADWRDKALDLYFTLIYDKGSRVTAGMKNAANTVILSHLADRPEVTGNGLWHVVMQVTLDNHQSFAVAVLLTDKCRVFDFAQGTWTSTFLDAVDVDLAMKM